VLALLLIFIAGVAWDTHEDVNSNHDDNIVIKQQIEGLKKEDEQIKADVGANTQNGRQNSEDIKELRAIIARDDRYWSEEKKNHFRTED